MRLQRCLRGIIATLVAVSLSPSSIVSALETSTPPVDYYPPIYITAFQTSRLVETVTAADGTSSEVATDTLQVVELHNDTSDPINLADWSVKASDENGLICQIALSSWLLPDDFVVIASSGAGMSDSTGNVRTFESCKQDGRVMSVISLLKNGESQEQIRQPNVGAWVRKNTTKTYRSGEFSKDFEAMNSTSRATFYAGVWYDPLSETALQISEILPHSRSCSPLETALDCSDYVKLYNPTNQAVDLSGLRLRFGYQGQSVTTSNAITLAGSLAPDSYGVIAKKLGGDTLSVTDGGGWVWLEDTYGIVRYDATVVAYPSASSVTKVGWAWAYNPATGQWQWTSTPTPQNAPSVFTQPIEEATVGATASSTLTPCRSDQYRNPLTNRCKLLSSTTSNLTPCTANQYRNPETNRCKSLSSTSSSLKPCASNQERNPETNRCRTKAVLAAADFPVETTAETPQDTLGWWAFAGVGSMAVSYAGWEWRRELGALVKRLASFFTR